MVTVRVRVWVMDYGVIGLLLSNKTLTYIES